MSPGILFNILVSVSPHSATNSVLLVYIYHSWCIRGRI